MYICRIPIFPTFRIFFYGISKHPLLHSLNFVIISDNQFIPFNKIKSRFRISGCYSSTPLTIVSSSKLSTPETDKCKTFTFLLYTSKSHFHIISLSILFLENLLSLEQLPTLYSYDLT